MSSTQDLFAHNRAWAAQMKAERPGFFTGLEAQQSPKYMWIGCSDSRVPANQITGLEPGEVFVHRNVGNVVVPTDLNCLSTLIEATTVDARQDVLCELNAIEQVVNVAQTTVVQDAWLRKQPLTLHGWVYGLKDGLLIDLNMTVSCNEDLDAAYAKAIEMVGQTNRALTTAKLVA